MGNPLFDKRLSLKAKGLYAMMTAEPYLTLMAAQEHSANGRNAVRTACHELMDAGYVERIIEHGPNGRIASTRYILRGNPQCQS